MVRASAKHRLSVNQVATFSIPCLVSVSVKFIYLSAAVAKHYTA